ncbi:hypothetical protein SK128_010706, partial [Halocaridina rubra]
MAPALTQASDPQTFHVAAAHHHHSTAAATTRPGEEAPLAHTSPAPPPTTHFSLQYGGLKEPPDCTDAHLTAALTNGTRRIRLLKPPSPPAEAAGGLACGREGCRDPPARPHATTHFTMDLSSGVSQAPLLSHTEPPTNSSSSSASVPNNCIQSVASTAFTTPTTATTTTTTTTNMGQDTLNQQGTQGSPSTQDNKNQRPVTQDGDLLALIGRDFANMNEIIDTLTRLADNPEVIAAVDTAAMDLAGSSNSSSSNNHGQPSLVSPVVPQISKEERSQLLLDDLSRRQWQMERRQSRLLRRLRRVAARGLGASVSGQLRELLDYSQCVLAQQRERRASSQDGHSTSPGTPEMSVESLRADTMRGMSTSALISLVRRVEASQGLARLAAISRRPLRPQPTVPAPALPEDTRTEIGAVVTEIQAASLNHTHHDSDATESSSGGESCDELDGFSDKNTSHNTPV